MRSPRARASRSPLPPQSLPALPGFIACLVVLIAQGGCTLDLTDPDGLPHVADSPTTISVNLALDHDEDRCWEAALMHRPRVRAGVADPVADSTVLIDGEPLHPLDQNDPFDAFRYRVPRRCGATATTVAVELPSPGGTPELPLPLDALPLIWREAPWEYRTPPGSLEFPTPYVPLRALPHDGFATWSFRIRSSDPSSGTGQTTLHLAAPGLPPGIIALPSSLVEAPEVTEWRATLEVVYRWMHEQGDEVVVQVYLTIRHHWRLVLEDEVSGDDA
jgi:hypothetical protein